MLLWLAFACQNQDSGSGITGENDSSVLVDSTSTTDSSSTTVTYTDGEQAIASNSFAGKNLLIISMDTTRVGRLQTWGNETSPNPEFEGILAQGLVVEAMSANWTFPSMSVLQTARSLKELGVLVFRPPGANGQDPLPASEDLFTEVLARSGYDDSILYTGNDMFGPDRGLTDGFADVQIYVPWRDQIEEVYSELTVFIESREEDNSNKPWVAWHHANAAHDAYAPPPEFTSCPSNARLPDGMVNDANVLPNLEAAWDSYDTATQEAAMAWVLCQYDGELNMDMYFLGKFLREQIANGLLESTLVVFLTDHGEAFEDHGFFTHGNTVWLEETRTGAVFLGAGIEPGRFNGFIGQQDIAPTILSALGIDIPPTMTGVPLGMGEGRILETFTCTTWQAAALHTSSGKWAISDPSAGLLEAYDIGIDPDTTSPLDAVPSDIDAALSGMFEASVAEMWCSG